MAKATKNVEATFRAAWELSGGLDGADKARFRQRLAKLAKVATAAARGRAEVVGYDGGLLDGVRVVRPGEPGYEQAKRDAMPSNPVDWEWDLWAANELDKVYQSVADATGTVVKSAAGAAGAVVVPALMVLALVFALRR